MKKWFINYASNGFIESQRLGIEQAKLFGFETKSYSYEDIDLLFKIKNCEILQSVRGGGYWLWKPYIILDMLNNIDDGDYLIYMDSGAYLMHDPQKYLDMIDEGGVLCFSMVQKTSKWTKGDCFHILDSELKFKDNNQIQGTYLFLQKNINCINFIKEWLYNCCNVNMISDKPNIYLDNYSDFIDHRHDQSILSLMVYSNKIKFIPQLDQYCIEHGIGLNNQIINRHGKRF